MRKITKESVDAFRNWKNFYFSNTTVKKEGDRILFYLHNNLIGEYKFGAYMFDTCGYNTLTTFERLRGIASLFGGTVKREKGKNYIIYNGEKKEFIRRFTKARQGQIVTDLDNNF